MKSRLRRTQRADPGLGHTKTRPNSMRVGSTSRLTGAANLACGGRDGGTAGHQRRRQLHAKLALRGGVSVCGQHSGEQCRTPGRILALPLAGRVALGTLLNLSAPRSLICNTGR